ncbi:MAG: hypothetical protein FD189_1085 [Elusimicrobia bacterium]|nr:MAG: hypothetical protein FD189_1085 [Elusimicrobiota bacterium]
MATVAKVGEFVAVMPNIQTVELTLRGLPGSLLVVHNFSEKAKQEIRDKQQKKAKKAKEQRDPQAEFLANRYVDGRGRECVPITAIKKAIVSAAPALDDAKKTHLRQAIFVDSPTEPGAMLIPVEKYDGSPATGEFREDPVTLGMNIRGLAYRPGYAEWQCRVKIQYNVRMLSLEQLLALVDQAGWGIGICEGRPEKSSALGWGRFGRVE